MASVQSPIRTFLKPILYRLLGKRGYFYAQYFAKLKDIRDRLVEEKEMVLLPEFVRPGDEVLDIGANFAYYTTRLSALVGKMGKVYAFEPIPFTYRVCQKIVDHFGVGNVEVFQKGVGKTNERVTFSVPVVGFGGISAGQAHLGTRVNDKKDTSYTFDKHEAVQCEVVALDSFLSNKLKKLSFIKIDIEGAEYFALQGMKNILQKFRPTILIEIVPSFLEGFKIDSKEFVRFLTEELGYEVFHYEAASHRLQPLRTQPWENNYILVHKSKLPSVCHLIAEAA